MSRTITIPVKNTEQYLQIFNGLIELTQKEVSILASFIDLGETINLCSSQTKEGRRKLGHSRPKHSEQLREEIEGQRGYSKNQRWVQT